MIDKMQSMLHVVKSVKENVQQATRFYNSRIIMSDGLQNLTP
jgi:hypothetical protein